LLLNQRTQPEGLQLMRQSLGRTTELLTGGRHSPMRNPLRLAAKMFWIGGAATMGYLLYLHGTYAEHMPREPQPSTGRTQQVFVMRSDRYVTEAEATRLDWATRIQPIFVLGFIGVIYLQKRQTRS
jgi:hypothetical protein